MSQSAGPAVPPAVCVPRISKRKEDRGKACMADNCQIAAVFLNGESNIRGLYIKDCPGATSSAISFLTIKIVICFGIMG
jgi:hypothetical protein